MAASRLINLQHHRIAQCQSIQITILGDEGVPIQVDGEAWVQPPGIIRIIHKNRAQMLCRNRSLEMSLKSWQEKQRQHSISISREHTSNMSDSTTTAGATSAASLPSGLMSERESYLLLNFIECASSLVSANINKHKHFSSHFGRMNVRFQFCCCRCTGEMGKVFNHITSIVGARFICGCLSYGRCTWRWIKAQTQHIVKCHSQTQLNHTSIFTFMQQYIRKGKLSKGQIYVFNWPN